jgi:hypothetical protein
MPDGAADASEQPGDGRSNSLEPRAVRYELFVGNGTSPFDERKSTFHTGASWRNCIRSTAHGIHGRCDWLRAAQDIHRDLSARRRRLLRRSSALETGALACARETTSADPSQNPRASKFLATSLCLTAVTLAWPAEALAKEATI